MIQVIVKGVWRQLHIVLSLQNIKHFLRIVQQKWSTCLVKSQRNLATGIHPGRVTHAKANQPFAWCIIIHRMHIVP